MKSTNKPELDSAMTGIPPNDAQLFEHLPNVMVNWLEQSRTASLESQDTLYREGESADTVYVIRQGMVKLLSYLPNGRARIVRLYGPGSVIGLDGLVEPTYEHTAVTIGNSFVYKIPASRVNHLRDSDPREFAHILEFWHEYLRVADTWITEFSTGAIKARVARLLNFLSQIEVDTSPDEVHLLTCDEMAAILGVTPESVSRVLAEFKREDILQRTHTSSEDVYRQDIEAVNQAAEE